MRKETRNLFIVEGIVLLVVLSIGIGYAFLSTSGKQELANTFTAGCLSITIEEEGRAIDLENAYPITDIEGLEQDGYTFKIKNNCSNDTNYQINLESLSNPTADTTLKADYVRVSLSSDTMDNLITTLKENDVATYHSENAYVSYNLYSGILKGSASKSFTLKEWVEYNTTKEEGASKEYKSQINVVSDTRVEVTPTPEVKFTYSDKKYTGVLTEEATNVKYCMTTDNKCNADKDIEVSNKEITIEAEENDNKQMICTKIENKTYCSNPELIEKPKPCPEGASACETILANSEIKGQVTTVTGPSCSGNKGGICYDSGSQNNNMAENGIYSVEDDFGTSYVFRGTLDNNWVKFGQEDGKDIWWRIIRINGNGTIRLIYAGTNTAGGTTAPATTGEGTQITTTYSDDTTVQQYNAAYDDNTYVGFMNNGGATSAYNTANQNSKDSTIKGELDTWWTNTNLGSPGIVEKIDIDTGFCNDRELADSDHGNYQGKGKGGYAKQQTAYAPVHRVWNSSTSYDTTQEPTLKCANPTRDLFTGQNSKGATTKDGKTILGNKKLTNPVGLITSDEVIYAGGFAGQNNNKYWLYTNKAYWTMSPSDFSGSYAHVFRVISSGFLGNDYVYSANGVRPVINLTADTTFTGTGASNNPYKVS